MILIYVAGPYRRFVDNRGKVHKVADNIQAAHEATRKLIRKGYAVHCPHKNTAGFEEYPEFTDKDFLIMDLEILSRCDALFLLPYWSYSGGTKLELAWANKFGLKIYSDDVEYNQPPDISSPL